MCAALDFRARIGGEFAIMAYNRDLAVWAGQYLARAWGTECLGTDGFAGAMANVRLPVSDLIQATLLSKELGATYDTVVVVFAFAGSIWMRVSAQIFLERSDFVLLAERVLCLLKQARDRQASGDAV